MHLFVISKNVKWCHLIWPTRYIEFINKSLRVLHSSRLVCVHFGVGGLNHTGVQMFTVVGPYRVRR